jgi:hypothetical protein
VWNAKIRLAHDSAALRTPGIERWGILKMFACYTTDPTARPRRHANATRSFRRTDASTCRGISPHHGPALAGKLLAMVPKRPGRRTKHRPCRRRPARCAALASAQATGPNVNHIAGSLAKGIDSTLINA